MAGSSLSVKGRARRRASGVLCLLTLACFCAPLAGAAAPQPGSGGRNAAEHLDKPYVVIVSIDGMRWDFPDLYETPALARIASRGLRAEALQPVFPTLTFPNHYSIATGVVPARHGLVANQFPAADGRWYSYRDRDTVQDGRWYGAEPFWVTAEQAGMVASAFFFVGSEADVQGVRPTHWRPFDAAIEPARRAGQVLEWLAAPPAERPHLLMLYFEQVDENSHWYGPGSEQSRQAIRQVDRQLGELLDGIAALPHADQVYLLVVSDHGQAAYTHREPPLVLEYLVGLDGIRAVDGGSFVFLHFAEDDAARVLSLRERINEHWSCGRALRPADAPAAWQLDENPRFPDLIVQADPGCAVISTAARRDKMTAGDHGWAPEMPEMRGVFYAMGPRIVPNSRTGTVRVTEIYPLVMDILGLPAAHDIDGDPERLPALLLPKPEPSTR